MHEIREEDIKNALAGDFAELEEIHKRILILHEELSNTVSMIQSAAMKSPRYGNVGGGAGTQKNDLTEIMIRHERLQRQREIEIREEIFRLTEEEEVINRIRVCYQALRGKEYGFLRELYVRGHPYKVVEKNSGVSHGTFERIRKSGIRKIQQMYASNFSNQEIIAKSSERHKRKSKKGGGEKYEQIKLDL